MANHCCKKMWRCGVSLGQSGPFYLMPTNNNEDGCCKSFDAWINLALRPITDYGHPDRAFFSKIRNFWACEDKLGWNLMRHLGYFWPNYKLYFVTVSPLFMGKCSWISFLQKLWFLGLKHITPKYSQNKNLGNSVHTSVFGEYAHSEDLIWQFLCGLRLFQ